MKNMKSIKDFMPLTKVVNKNNPKIKKSKKKWKIAKKN
jgi:hypothetical protein